MKELDHSLSRRHFISRCLQAGVALPLLVSGWPQLALAEAATDKRLLLVFLRGGLDSLDTLVPYADPHYRAVRAGLAMQARDEQLIAADDFFAFHRSLGYLADLYQQGQMAAVHAVATPYRSRSHFDAQDLLENGSDAAHRLDSGWLNRAIQVLGGAQTRLGLSVGPAIPLLLRGAAQVASWSPSNLRQANEDVLERMARMYQNDPLLGDALRVAMDNAEITGAMTGRAGRGNAAFVSMMDAAARFLAQADGPRIATVDFGGFDTHSRQAPRLAQQLEGLDQGIRAYRGQTPDAVWQNTLIYVVSEFGRTVRPNGSQGTDHGTAGLALLIGGSVKGRQIISRWPGLADNRLFEGRDLNPTTDLRSVSKHILGAHFGLSAQEIDRHILPGSLGLAPVEFL